MTLDRNSNGINSDCDSPAVWVVPAALQQLVEFGDAELVEELISIFQTDTAERLELLGRAVAAADYATVRAEAHTIKGSSLQVGANLMADVCRQMELEARKSQPVDLVEPLARLLRSFEQVRAVIAARQPGAPAGKT